MSLDFGSAGRITMQMGNGFCGELNRLMVWTLKLSARSSDFISSVGISVGMPFNTISRVRSSGSLKE